MILSVGVSNEVQQGWCVIPRFLHFVPHSNLRGIGFYDTIIRNDGVNSFANTSAIQARQNNTGV